MIAFKPPSTERLSVCRRDSISFCRLTPLETSEVLTGNQGVTLKR